MIRFVCLILAPVCVAPLFAQPAGGPPAFEIADVHASAHPGNQRMTGGALIGDRYAIHHASMLELIRTAYGIDERTMFGADDDSRIVGGPSWLDLDRFDVIAKTLPGTSREALKLMLRTLLADRFKLAVHADTKPLPGFVLSMGTGKPKFREADGSGEAGCQSHSGDPEYFEYACRNMTMEAFAQGLRGMSFALNGPVVNQTGLKGSWNFELKWRGPENVSIFDAIDHQLGLKLQTQKVPRPVIVIDSVARRPTENPPGVATTLPPPPSAKFEVAVIKPSAPGENPGRRTQPGGRFDLEANTLRMMINFAWNVNDDEMLAGAPSFLDAVRFDVRAEAPTGSGGQSDSAPVDIDDFRAMLQALLAERFKLSTHMEDRPISAYRLLAAKPKLQKADPSNRTRCKEGPGADGNDPRVSAPWLARLVTCQNVTMAQFAEQIPSLAGGYVNSPVVDGTGIEGDFDLTLSFSPAGLLRSANQAAPGGGAASDPNGLLSFFDALDKLGLRLKTEKRSLPVLVIDHVEEQPASN
ncbi:MAG TPA: TIGR03435 family protein [Bryobacteraceae bacterium]